MSVMLKWIHQGLSGHTLYLIYYVLELVRLGQLRENDKESTVISILIVNLTASKTIICFVGGTVGSGVFVLTGLIAREYTGPGVVISWLIAGFGCCFSAMSYAELSCRIPSAGSSYAYVYVALGKCASKILLALSDINFAATAIFFHFYQSNS